MLSKNQFLLYLFIKGLVNIFKIKVQFVCTTDKIKNPLVHTKQLNAMCKYNSICMFLAHVYNLSVLNSVYVLLPSY